MSSLLVGRVVRLPVVRPPTRYFDADFVFDELKFVANEHLVRVGSLCVGDGGDARAARATTAADRAASRWDIFYTKNGAGAYKPRHFIVQAFPVLSTCATVVDIGCGAGANVWPLLSKTDVRRVFATDVAPAALAALAAHPDAAEAVGSGKLTLFLWDFSTNKPPLPLPRPPVPQARIDAESSWRVQSLPVIGMAEAVLLTFTASAMHPRDHADAFRSAAAMLAVGGRLLFRDHGARDLAQLRAVDAAILLPSLNERGDGTLAYFFTLDEVRKHLSDAGLVVEELSHACVTNNNRKTGAKMRRVFVHAVGRKP